MMELNIRKDQWVKVKLLDVFIKKEENDKENAHNRFDRFLKVEHMDAESLHIKRWASQENGDEINPTFYKIFRKGQILFPTRNPHLRRTALASFDGICGEKTLTLEPNGKLVIPEFIPFLFHSESFYAHTAGAIVGSTNPHVRWRDVANYEFLLPPKDQQAQLAELLWAMDEVIEREREVLDRLGKTFQSYSKKLFKEDANRFIPLSECAEVIMGQSPAGDSYNQDGNGTPLINGPTEFTDRYPIKIQWTTKPTKFCQDRDILLCVRGSTTGRMNISNDTYCIGRGVAAIRGKGLFKTDFLEFVLRFNVDEIMRLASGSTFPNIDSKTLKSIMLPKVDDQQQELIISTLKALDENNMRIDLKISTSQALQKSLINQIF